LPTSAPINRIRAGCCARAASGADQPHPGRLLCARRERPCCRRTYKRDELSPPHRGTHQAQGNNLPHSLMLIGGLVASHQNAMLDFRFGSQADMTT
jgi:hypothetical protein